MINGNEGVKALHFALIPFIICITGNGKKVYFQDLISQSFPEYLELSCSLLVDCLID